MFLLLGSGGGGGAHKRTHEKVVMFGHTGTLEPGFLGQLWFLTRHASLSSQR